MAFLFEKKGSKFDLVGYYDVEFVGEKVERKRNNGACQFLGKSLVSWSSKKQSTIDLSTPKAEYVSTASCCSQIIWIK